MLERVTYICEFSIDTDGPAKLGLGQELEVPDTERLGGANPEFRKTNCHLCPQVLHDHSQANVERHIAPLGTLQQILCKLPQPRSGH